MSILGIFGQNTKAIPLLFGQKCLIFITFQSAIKINQFQFWAFLAKIPRLQPYFLAKNASFSSLFNLQSKSINFNFGHFWPKYQGYSLTFWPNIPHFHHFSICNQNQSISILVIFGQNTKAIALRFGQTCLIFITFQSAIKINHFQFWSFLAKIPRLQPYFLAKNASFSSLFNLQSKSINFNFWSFLARIPRLQPYFSAKNASFSSLVNLQSKSINFNLGYYWPKYKAYCLTCWPKMPHFHHFSICNQNQSISILVIIGQNTTPIASLLGQTSLIVITFQSAIKINQFQFWSFLAKIPWLQPYFLAKNASFSSLFNLQSKSINFNFGHYWPKYQGYSLTFWPKMPHFHHFSICNQNQSISIFGHFWPEYQGYSLTFRPKMPHFHHLSICNQNQSISILVIFGQNTKAIPLRFGQTCLIFITFQSAIKINHFQFWSFLAKIPRLQPYFLAKNASFSSLVNLQSKSINFNFGYYWPKDKAYCLTCWPKMPHFHHFSICNQNQSISILVIYWPKYQRLQPYFLAKHPSLSSLFNLQSKSINFNFGHFWPKYHGYTKNASLSTFGQSAHFSILLIFGQNTKAIPQKCLMFITICNQNQSMSIFWPKYQGYTLTFWPTMPHFHHFSICNQNQSISILAKITKAFTWPKYQGYSLTFWPKMPPNIPHFHHLLASLIFVSSLFNLQSKSINFNFYLAKIPTPHFWPKYQGYTLTFWPKMPHFHHFSICNQNQSISILVIFGQNTKAIPLLFGQKCLIFITFQSAIKINQFQFWAFLAKIPRLQPYFPAKNASLSSLFNLQSKSINFNFGHFWPKYQGYSLTFWPKMPHFHHFSICNQNQSISILVIFGQNTTAIALLFGQTCLIFITFQSAIKINQFQFWSFLAKIPRLQPYFLAKNASFSSLFNLQSKSINFNFWSFLARIPRLQPYFSAKNASFSSLFNLQSKSINFNFGHYWPKYQGYSLTFWPKMPHFHHFSICNQNQSISIWSFLAKIQRLLPHFLAKHPSLSSLFNLQSKSINFNFGHFWPRSHGYSLTFWPKMPHCHHFSICNQNQSISIWLPRLYPYVSAKNASLSSLFNLQSKSINFNHFWPKYQGYSLTFWPKCQTCLIFITFQSAIKINQFQFWSFLAKIPRLQPYFHWPKMPHASIFITFQSAIKINQFQFWSFLAKIPRLQPYFLAKNASFSSLFNLQSKSINFNFGHFWPKYQGYSLTCWPKMPHFHHFSICNQNQSISILVIFGQNTKAIALLSGQKCLIVITFQSAIKINQFQVWSFLAKIPRLQPYFLAKNASFSSLFNLQSKSINFNFGHFWPKYQGYSLTFWPNIPHFHHFSICNQNQSISILVIFGQNTKAIALLFGQKCLIFITFQSAIKINQFQFLVIFGQNTKAIALLFGQKCLIFITFQSAIKINQFQFWSFLAKIPRLQPYFLANMPHFHHFSICNQNQSISILVIFGQNTTAIPLRFGQTCLIFITFQSAIKINHFQFWSFLAKIPRLQPYFLANMPHFHHFSICNQNQSISIFGHFWPDYQGYSLTFRPKMPHFHHLSICNQNQSISILVIIGQNTKPIALLVGQKCLIFITFQSAMKINQFQCWLLLAKIQRLLPHFLAKHPSLSSLFNLQSKSINFNFGHFWPRYHGYSLTFWPKMPHCHHFSICNQNQSISILVIFGQNTKAIPLLVGQKCLIFITFQSGININQCQFWAFLAKIPRLQPYFLAKNASFSSLFNLQSKSINFKFGHFWPKYQGYSLTSWPKMPHFHHFSICNQNQSISILVIFGQNTKAIALLFGQTSLIFITFQSAIKINQFQFWSFLAKIPRLQPYFLAKNASFSSLFNLQSKSINFNFWSFLARIPRLQPYFSAKNASFSSLFNLQSKSINFNFGHVWPKYQGYSLTFWPKMPHFHHFSICNQNQSISIVVIFGQNTTAIALRFGQQCLIFITFQSAIKINQFQLWSLLAKIPRLQPYFLAKNASFSSLFNLQSKSINFNFWSFLARIPRLQPYFLAKNASFSSLVNLQSKSINFNLGHYWPKYQGYSLTFWPKMPHFHHFSICNQNQSISILVIFGQDTKAIALLLAKNASFSSLFNLQSKSINFNFGYYWPKYTAYCLTCWPKMPHFHHFSICNENQSISILGIIGQNTTPIASLLGQKCLIVITFQSAIKINQFQFWSFLAKIPRLQPYFLAKNASFSSLFNLQSKSINFNFGHFWPKYQGYSLTSWPKMPHFHHLSICNQNQSISILVIIGQNTKPIALLVGQKCLIFITFQSAMKINQFQFWLLLAKIQRLLPHFLAKHPSLSSLFNLQSKSINFNFGHFWPRSHGYSLTFWPKMPHCHHFSICNQNQSISILVIFGQNTKAIALLFGQKCLMFITFQSAIKINQFQFWAFLAKIPRLYPYFLAKNA